MPEFSFWGGRAVAIAATVHAGHRFLHDLAVITTLVGVVFGANAGAATGAAARTLMVGAGQAFAQPSDAARAVAAGDSVHILPGTYFDCANWTADHLMIEGSGPSTVLTDASCQGKASFVISGKDVTVRDLTFTRIRVADGNGAGIRAEGAGLVVQHVRFDNNQAGLLAVSQPDATIELIGCVFLNNGTTDRGRVPASVEVGELRRLTIRDSVFMPGRAGAAVVSSADLTDIVGSRFAASPASADIPKTATIQVGGGLILVDSELEASETRAGIKAAVQALPGPATDSELALRRNRLEGGGALLLNWSGRTAVLDANRIGPDAVEQTSSGAWSYQLRRVAHTTYDGLNAMAHRLARRAIDLARSQWARNP